MRRGRPGAASAVGAERGADGRERRSPKPTRATQAPESTGSEAPRRRSRPPAPPLGVSAENKVAPPPPTRPAARAHRRHRHSELRFGLDARRARGFCARAGGLRSPRPRDLALAGHVSPPHPGPAGPVRGGGGGRGGMSLSNNARARPGSAGREACLVLAVGATPPCNGRALGGAPRAQGPPLRGRLALERASAGGGTLERNGGKMEGVGAPRALGGRRECQEGLGELQMPAMEGDSDRAEGWKRVRGGHGSKAVGILEPTRGKPSTLARDPEPDWEPKDVIV